MDKNIISIDSLSLKEISLIMKLAGKLKRAPFMRKAALANKTLALLFQKPSNRTRISFEVAMTHLGGYTLYLSPEEINMGVREPVKDVACVVSRYVDIIVARVFSHNDILTLARYSSVPVINGLSDLEHPCQALSDLFTIKEKFRSLKKVKLAYVGDGNNVLNSLLMIAAKTGLDISVATPKGYEPAREIFDKAAAAAKKSGSVVTISNDPFTAVRGADVVYTDVWASMGQEADKQQRLLDFNGFQINETLMKSAGADAFIMHCLPAHRGEEITDVVDGKNSIIYDQAENRMHVQKAILLKMLGK
ncbi:MAG: ornithine carbamoyltransferase [Candidatus Omnitrophica bacterium]|nr:ornithine carbamoyltransferase [Candidatus Omnitrophota bacterium]MBU1127985.1 ornithine carbamoyltransferase [Candidatus Omnitrophota bacterium]MBU1784860.1 ornithine carbamoyltransferase [Candidatus Omnitrophota bacterium]MBU1851694.1 ornithine carbamoyltransferase [Candidatus Omnitrophota bacterium]